MNEKFATNADIKETELKLESKLDYVVQKLESAILTTRKESELKFEKLESSIREVEYKMTIKLGAMMTIAIGVTATLVKLLPNLH